MDRDRIFDVGIKWSFVETFDSILSSMSILFGRTPELSLAIPVQLSLPIDRIRPHPAPPPCQTGALITKEVCAFAPNLSWF